jgi:hypothetical protein
MGSIYIPNAGGPGGVNNYIWDVSTLAWIAQTATAATGGAGDASAANQTTEIARLTAILADVDKIPSQGQALAAGSTPVVLTAIQVAALTPPAAITGFALEAGHLAAIDTSTAKIPAQGQALAAASLPVVLTAAQITTLTPPAAITGFATEAGHLAAIDTSTAKIPALGQALAAGSVPVVMTAAQLTTLTPPAAITGFNLEATQLLVKAKTDNLDVLLSTRLKAADTLAAVTNLAQLGGQAVAMGTGVRSAGTLRVTVATDDLVPVSLPTLTKGTQGATGASTQDLKDAGRNLVTLFMPAVVITTVAEVMQTLSGYKSGAAVAGTATPAVVTAGKTFRITSVEITYLDATVIGGALIRLRALAGGVALIGSPLVKAWWVGTPAAFAAGIAETYTFNYPDGLEFAAGFGIAIGVQGVGADGTTGTITGKVMVCIHGFEY